MGELKENLRNAEQSLQQKDSWVRRLLQEHTNDTSALDRAVLTLTEDLQSEDHRVQELEPFVLGLGRAFARPTLGF